MKFTSMAKKQHHERACPYVPVKCQTRECSQHNKMTYTLPALQQHLNGFHGMQIREIPQEYVLMQGEQKKAKEGRYTFWWKDLFTPNIPYKSINVVTKFDGFLFCVHFETRMTTQRDLVGYGSERQEEYLVASAHFIGVEGFPEKFKFRLEYFDPRDPDKYSDILVYNMDMPSLNHKLKVGQVGEETGLPMSIARQYQHTQDLGVVAIFEKEKTKKWLKELGPLSTYYDV